MKKEIFDLFNNGEYDRVITEAKKANDKQAANAALVGLIVSIVFSSIVFITIIFRR